MGLASGTYDPEGTLRGYVQTLPFAAGGQNVMDPVVAAGARALIGSLSGYPGDSYEYYVPYHGVLQPIPAVWISGSEGARLREMLAAGPVSARLAVESDIHAATSNNVIGELAGRRRRAGDHRLAPRRALDLGRRGRFGHRSGAGAGGVLVARCRAKSDRTGWSSSWTPGTWSARRAGAAFIAAHEADMPRTVLEVHLEHAALEFVERDGKLAATGQPEPRWWFTTRIPRLQAAVLERNRDREADAIPGPAAERLRSQPAFRRQRLQRGRRPAVSFLTAPFYLFDSIDTLDKVDRDGLAPITRACIRIIESTRGETAKSMRDAIKT